MRLEINWSTSVFVVIIYVLVYLFISGWYEIKGLYHNSEPIPIIGIISR